MSKPMSNWDAPDLKVRSGATHAVSNRESNASIDTTQEQYNSLFVHYDAHDLPEEELNRKAVALILAGLIEDLPEMQRMCVEAWIYQARGHSLDKTQGKDSGFRKAARSMVNPKTGKSPDKGTLEKHLRLGLDQIAERITELPLLERRLIAKGLKPGTLDLEDDCSPAGFVKEPDFLTEGTQ